MTIEEWLSDKKKLFGGHTEQLSKGSRIIDAWWTLSEESPALRQKMKGAADKMLNECDIG